MILQLSLSLLISICILYLANAADHCYRTCGNGKSTKHVPYPFGFSPGCAIRLTCANATVKIGEFEVQNVTADSIFVNLPAKCHRQITSLRPLFGPNYGMTWQNSLLLQNCTTHQNGCVIPTSLVEQRFNLKTCGVGSDNITCFSWPYNENKSASFMSFNDLNRTRCNYLFSSLAFNSGGNSGGSLEFQLLELGWGLNGSCNCSKNADCTRNFTFANGIPGHRCRCQEGFEGDGFVAGDGCRRSELTRRFLLNPFNYLFA